MIIAVMGSGLLWAQAEPPGSEITNVTGADGTVVRDVSPIEVGEIDPANVYLDTVQSERISAVPPPDLGSVAIEGKVLSIEKNVWLYPLLNPPHGYMSEAMVNFIHQYAKAPLKVLSIEMRRSSSSPRETILIVGSLDESAVIDTCERFATRAYVVGSWFVLAADRGTNPPGENNRYIWLNAKNSDGNASLVHCSLPFKDN